MKPIILPWGIGDGPLRFDNSPPRRSLDPGQCVDTLGCKNADGRNLFPKMFFFFMVIFQERYVPHTPGAQL